MTENGIDVRVEADFAADGVLGVTVTVRAGDASRTFVFTARDPEPRTFAAPPSAVCEVQTTVDFVPAGVPSLRLPPRAYAGSEIVIDVRGVGIQRVELDGAANDWELLERIQVEFAFDAERRTTNVELTGDAPRTTIASDVPLLPRPAYRCRPLFFLDGGRVREGEELRGTDPVLAVRCPWERRRVRIRSAGIVDGARNVQQIFLSLSMPAAAEGVSLELNGEAPATTVDVLVDPARGAGPLTYEGTIVFADGRVEQILPAHTEQDLIVAGDIAPRFSVRIDPSLVQWSREHIRDVRLELESANARASFDFDPHSSTPRVWEFDAPEEAVYSWRAAYRFEDGSLQTTGAAGRERNLVLPPRPF